MGEREGRGQSDLTAALKISLDISFFRQDLFLPLLFSWKQTVKKRTKRDKRKTCSIQKPKRDIRQEEEITNRGGEEDSKTEKKKKSFLSLSSFFFLSPLARSFIPPLPQPPCFFSSFRLPYPNRFLSLLVDPLGHGGGVLGQALGEPQRDLALGGLDGVGAVDDVAADAVFEFF